MQILNKFIVKNVTFFIQKQNSVNLDITGRYQQKAYIRRLQRLAWHWDDSKL